MTLASRFGLLLALSAASCAEPAQLGGLGVFNPNGVNGRMQLASRVSGSDGPTGPRASPRRIDSRALRPRAADAEPSVDGAGPSPCER
jgi:hypothetical protein